MCVLRSALYVDYSSYHVYLSVCLSVCVSIRVYVSWRSGVQILLREVQLFSLKLADCICLALLDMYMYISCACIPIYVGTTRGE